MNRAGQSRLISREIVRLAVPALGALAADPVVSLVDTAFVGRLGTNELAGLGVASAIFMLAFATFNFLAYGTTSLVARRIGAGDRPGAGQIVVQAIVIAVVIGASALIPVETWSRQLLELMQAEAEVVEVAEPYLRIRALAIPAVLLITVGHGAFRGFQDTRTPLLVTLGLNLINLVLDPLLIFGLGWGIEGAAVATLVAQWTGALWFVFLFRRVVDEWQMPRFRTLLPFLGVGGALTVRTLALVLVLTYATATAAAIGSAEVAAHQVVSQWMLFLALTVDALAIAAQAMVGRFLGAGDGDALRMTVRRLFTWGLWVGLTLGAALFLARHAIAGWFTTAIDVNDLVVSALAILALIQPLGALVFVGDGVYLGAGAFNFLALATGVSAMAAAVMLLLVPGAGWGLVGVWWSIAVLIGLRGAAFLGRIAVKREIG